MLDKAVFVNLMELHHNNVERTEACYSPHLSAFDLFAQDVIKLLPTHDVIHDQIHRVIEKKIVWKCG